MTRVLLVGIGILAATAWGMLVAALWDKKHKCARPKGVTPDEREAQRRSFAYGNAHLSNPNVTREMIDQAAEELARDAAVAQPEEEEEK